MKHMLIQNLLAPLLRRLGVGLGSAFAAWGITAEQVATLEAAAVVLGGVILDLVLSSANRSSGE
jgi:hypothetical protein